MDLIKNILKKSRNNKKIIAVTQFGSSVNSKNYSDIDLCLFLDKKYSNIEMSKIRLDFLKEFDKKADIHIFQQLPMYIRIRILKGKILFCNDYEKLYEIAFNTIKEFGFYKKIYDMYLEEVKNGWKKNSRKNRRNW